MSFPTDGEIEEFGQVMDRLVEAGWVSRCARSGNRAEFIMTEEGIVSARLLRAFVRTFGDSGLSESTRKTFFLVVCNPAFGKVDDAG